MIVTFQSQAAQDVIMFGDVAYRLMEIMGHEAAAKGIVTVEQLPDAIARLRAAITADKQQQAATPEDESPQADSQSESRQLVSLAQRAVPLLDMLQWSLRKNKPVMWGV
jgi:hypothetical protein